MTPPYDPNNPSPPPQPGYQSPPQGYQQPGAWPPPPSGMYDPNAMQQNTSGMKGAVPPELAALKWNWGAFLLSFLWTVNHRMAWGWGILVLSLLSRIPALGIVFALVNFGIAIYVGLNGHKLGWQNRRFEGGLPQYFEVQNAWMKWGIGVSIILLIFGVIGAIGQFALLSHGGGTSSP